MDLNILHAEEDLKFDFETANPICRCCLSTDRRMFNSEPIASYLNELTGVNMQTFDSLPLRICYECCSYLYKAIKFKQRVLKAHSILYEYVTRCTPFTIEAKDPELNRYASPLLRCTPVLVFETNGKGRQGFQKVLSHKKELTRSKLNDIDLLPTTSGLKAEDDVKQEFRFSDYDDNIPLEEISENISQCNDEDIISDLKVENEVTEAASSKRKKRIKNGVKKKQRVDQTQEIEMEVKGRSIRRSLELDPSKIRVIQLNPEEQIKMREEESKASLKFPYQCHLCFKGFNFESKLVNHMQKHSPSRGPYECKTCKMYLPTPYSYSVHRLIHTQRYECVVCSRRMIDKPSILDHYRSQHEGLTSVFTCQICGKISTNSKTHRGHMRNHHADEGRPKCDQCGKSFVNKDSLHSHMQIHAGVKNYECAICGARFRTRSQIKHHHLKHSTEKKYYCVECDTRFKTAQALKTHLKKSIKHIDIESLRYPCLRCEKRFNTEAALSHHTLVQHEGVRGHRCEECGAALATANSLNKHIHSVHKGKRAEAKHVCDTCGKAFRGKSVLVNHVRTHTGEKPFECTYCGRKFGQRTAMRTHVNFIHLKIRRRAKIKPEISPELRGAKFVQMLAKEENPLVYETWREPANCDVFYQIEAT
ncbi:hypothetical protein K1T71_000823 [Dendrolimus kikuchii]|uniref:Uncharacterized protein n=1 Tax=Dendrolimus kikuchii TaxID=765133 RepID=A0ACC1DKH6_9NEOP|nr:hypothetical protein K1T71_000823 [Dendrolimus kikuchii]